MENSHRQSGFILSSKSLSLLMFPSLMASLWSYTQLLFALVTKCNSLYLIVFQSEHHLWLIIYHTLSAIDSAYTNEGNVHTYTQKAS